jgi:hypothetical protein
VRLRPPHALDKPRTRGQREKLARTRQKFEGSAISKERRLLREARCFALRAVDHYLVVDGEPPSSRARSPATHGRTRALQALVWTGVPSDAIGSPTYATHPGLFPRRQPAASESKGSNR